MTASFKLENLSCPSCIQHLESIEDHPGISKVEASFKKQIMRVDYDETIHTPASLAALIAEMGYIAIPHQNVDNSNKGALNWTKFFRF